MLAAPPDNRPIRLLRVWRRQPIGTVLTGIPLGMATDMVNRHRLAEWVDEPGSAPATPTNLNTFRERKKAKSQKSEDRGQKSDLRPPTC